MKNFLSSPHNRLTVTYIIALSIIAIMTILSYFLVNEHLVIHPDHPDNQQSYISRTINFGGACAATSQEVAVLVLSLKEQVIKNSDSAQKLFNQIEFKTNQLEKIYNGLKQGDSDFQLNARFNTPEIKQRFSEINVYFLGLKENIATILKYRQDPDSIRVYQVLETLSPKAILNAQILSGQMLKLNFDYDQQAADDISYWGQVELFLTLATLVLLLLEALFIFRPAARTIQKYVQDLSKRNKQLQEAYEELQANEEEFRQNSEVLANTNSKLLLSQSALKESQGLKDKFFSIIIHDLKGPLNSLKAITKLLYKFTDKISKEEIRETAEDLDKSIDHLFLFIDNLLTWSKLQMNHVHFHPKPVALRELVDRQLNLFKVYAQSKNIVLKYSVGSHIHVQADEYWLDIVMRNLVSNAMKFTPQGGEVKVSAKLKENFVEISVTDTGVGIEPHTLKQIFSINKHQPSQGTFGEKGTGLGLILSKEFIEKQNGTLSVISEIGKGSIFTFTLPAALQTIETSN